MRTVNFTKSIGYLKSGIEFLNSNRSILEKYLKILPDDLSQLVDELVKKDTKQEELKKLVPEKTALLKKMAREVFKQASAKVNIVKGVLSSAGQSAIVKAIPKISQSRTYEQQIGWLTSFRSFIEQYKDILSGYPQLDSAELTKGIDDIINRKKERDALQQERNNLTADIEKSMPKIIHKLVIWLDIAKGILEMEDRIDLVKQIPRQPVNKKKIIKV